MEVVGGGVSDGGHAENWASTDGDGDSDGGVCFML